MKEHKLQYRYWYQICFTVIGSMSDNRGPVMYVCHTVGAHRKHKLSLHIIVAVCDTNGVLPTYIEQELVIGF